MPLSEALLVPLRLRDRHRVMIRNKPSWNGTQISAFLWAFFMFILTSLSLPSLFAQIRSSSSVIPGFGPAINLPSSVTGLMNFGPWLPCWSSSSVYSRVVLLLLLTAGFPLQLPVNWALFGFQFLPFQPLLKRFPESKTVLR